jgi:hypothetical protein
MTDKPQELPSAGGSYIRDEKGGLKPAQPEPVTGTQKPAVKEG